MDFVTYLLHFTVLPMACQKYKAAYFIITEIQKCTVLAVLRVQLSNFDRRPIVFIRFLDRSCQALSFVRRYRYFLSTVYGIELKL